MKLEIDSKQHAQAVIDESASDPCQYLVVSGSFFFAEDHTIFPEVQLRCFERFSEWIKKLSQELGTPEIHVRGWNDFPEDTNAFYTAAWGKDGEHYKLSFEHEDRECPLMITFSRHEA